MRFLSNSSDWKDHIAPDTLASVELPAGEYVFCDPCYVIKYDPDEKPVEAKYPCRWSDGICGRIGGKDGKIFASFYTAYGDGVFDTSDDKYFGVDSGTLGAVDVKLCKPEREWPTIGSFYKFDGPAIINVNDLYAISLTRPGEKEPFLKVETASVDSILDDMYDIARKRWVTEHVTQAEFEEAVREFLKENPPSELTSTEAWNVAGEFWEHIDENGFNGEVYPSMREMAMNDELNWDYDTNTWMSHNTPLGYAANIIQKLSDEQRETPKP